MTKIVKVGKMPGRIQEVVVEVGTTLQDVLALADLDPSGFDVQVNGNKVDDLSQAVTESTDIILLAQKVKGNADVRTVKVGRMPGRIQEVAVETGTLISDVLAMVDLDPSGFDVQVDGSNVDLNTEPTVTSSTNLILLAQKVKGN